MAATDGERAARRAPASACPGSPACLSGPPLLTGPTGGLGHYFPNVLALQRFTRAYAAMCDRCLKVRRSNLGPDWHEAREALLDAGWQERPRSRLMIERAEWWCPACVRETAT